MKEAFRSEKMTSKAAKEMTEQATKIETECRHLISAVVPVGGSLPEICMVIKSATEIEQGKILFVPSGETL
ncbi:unnamed protein product [Cyprideis torosa]|uniref:Uncharacterized protein n=1 Tax=Cyprideis torosa TaxID=163714 RepID=A0A7R8WSH7_9CRUS|nr:unnamed protein product [Cyprideis torosa]CAG0909034.1 unnamed protein product [Cyprideis torosa]